MAAFGFIAPDFDLKESLLKLHTEQVAGFYDPEEAPSLPGPERRGRRASGDPL